MSDIDVPAAPFLARYESGEANGPDIGDYIAAWHESGDGEHRLLPEYLGMTEDEYDVWLMDHRMLPLVVAARRGGASLYDRVADYYENLREDNRWEDRAAIHVLSYWVPRHRPVT